MARNRTSEETVVPHRDITETSLEAAIPVLTFATAFVLASFLLGFQASALPSTGNSGGVYLELWAGTDNWTKASSPETFVLNVTNANATLSIYEVDINLSKNPTGYAVFTVSVANPTDWICNNATYDGLGRAVSINCSTSASPITTSSTLNITFLAQAMSLSTEASHDWQIAASVNSTPGYSVTQNITSGIDGLAPRFFGYSDNKTIASGSSSVYISVNVTDLNLDTSSVNIQVVNVNSGEAMSTPASSYLYYAASSVWNYSVANVPLSGFSDGNYTFNVTAYDNVLNSNSSLAAPASWFFYDAMAPSVALGSPGNNTNVSSGPVAFGFTPYDTSGVLANCSLWMTNSTGGNWHRNYTNITFITNNQQNTMTVNLNDGTYTWNVRCFDGFANSSFATANSTVNVANRSNIMVLDIAVAPIGTNPYPGQSILFNVTVKNNGSENVANLTWLQLMLDYDDSSCSSPSDTSYYNISESFLTVGGQVSIYYNVTLGSSHGTYYVCAVADYNNTETDESDINDNALTESFYTYFNVTLNSVSGSPRAGGQVKVNVTVKYYNGSPVTDLPATNFSIRDSWIAGDAGRNEDLLLNSSNITSFSGTSGVYTFNYTVPAIAMYSFWDNSNKRGYNMRYAEHGTHAIEINATGSVSGIYRTGISSTSPSAVNYTITAPHLVVTMTTFDDMDTEDSVSKRIYYSNEGNENVTDIITAHELDEEGSANIDANTSNTITRLDAGASYDMGYVEFTSDDTEGTSILTVNLSVTLSNGEKYWYEKIFEVTVTVPAADDTPVTPTTTPAATSYECTTNASCASDKYCKNLVCVALTCPDGYTATDHVCKFKNVYEVSILSSAREVKLLQGGNATSVVSVKNTGNTDLTVTVSAETGLDKVNSSTSPASQLIKAGETKNFTVTFTSEKSVPMGKYTGSFKATTSFTSAKDSESFTLVVNPLPEAIAQLERDYENYTAIYDQLVADFDAVKGQLSGENLTILETKINETMTLFALLKQAMDDKDYAQAAVYLSQLDALIDSARSTMRGLGIEEGVGSIWSAVAVWLIVAVVCVGAVGLLLYMLVPPQGYTHGKGYSPQGKGTVRDRIGGILSSLRNAVPGRSARPQATTASEIVRKYQLSYEGSYKKLQSAYQPQQPGMSDKMKGIFKKK